MDAGKKNATTLKKYDWDEQKNQKYDKLLNNSFSKFNSSINQISVQEKSWNLTNPASNLHVKSYSEVKNKTSENSSTRRLNITLLERSNSSVKSSKISENTHNIKAKKFSTQSLNYFDKITKKPSGMKEYIKTFSENFTEKLYAGIVFCALIGAVVFGIIYFR